MRTRLAIVTALMVHGMSGPIGSVSAQEKGLVFAHRGGAHEFDENTLDAFR